MNWHSMLETYLGLGVASYAVKTFPVPQNEYGRWLMGVINFALLNWEHGQQHFGAAAVMQLDQQAREPKA